MSDLKFQKGHSKFIIGNWDAIVFSEAYDYTGTVCICQDNATKCWRADLWTDAVFEISVFCYRSSNRILSY